MIAGSQDRKKASKFAATKEPRSFIKIKNKKKLNLTATQEQRSRKKGTKTEIKTETTKERIFQFVKLFPYFKFFS